MKENFYVGQIFEDMYPVDAANWCNKYQKKMVEIEPTDVRRFQIQETPEPSVEEKKATVRSTRDMYLNSIEWRISRYRDQLEIGVDTTDTEETYIKILQYMQYLRDYPSSSDKWYEENPKTFEEYCEYID